MNTIYKTFTLVQTVLNSFISQLARDNNNNNENWPIPNSHNFKLYNQYSIPFFFQYFCIINTNYLNYFCLPVLNPYPFSFFIWKKLYNFSYQFWRRLSFFIFKNKKAIKFQLHIFEKVIFFHFLKQKSKHNQQHLTYLH